MKKKTTRYQVRNWKEYNKGLVQRGSLPFWVEEKAIKGWLNAENSGRKGHPLVYATVAIETMSYLKAVYRLPLRATQGFSQSLFQLMGIDLPVPDYSTLCRRRKNLIIELPHQAKNEPIHLVVDSTGIKVYGEGEWKTRQHGYSKRRTWRKLHIGLDEATGEIMAAVVTDNKTSDKEIMPDILALVDAALKQVSADGGYDYVSVYQEIDKYNARAAIPPRRNATLRFTRQFQTRSEEHTSELQSRLHLVCRLLLEKKK